MFELLYVFRITKLFFAAHNNSVVDVKKRHLNILNILNGIELPSAPQSILHMILVYLSLVLDSNLVNITDITLSGLMYFILTTSKLPVMFFSFYQDTLALLVHLVQCLLGPSFHLLSLHISADCLEVVVFAVFPIFLSVCRALLGNMPFPKYSHLSLHKVSDTCF